MQAIKISKNENKCIETFDRKNADDLLKKINILLYDKSRNMFVKLKNDYAEISTNGLDNFKRSFDGGWVINH